MTSTPAERLIALLGAFDEACVETLNAVAALRRDASHAAESVRRGVPALDLFPDVDGERERRTTVAAFVGRISVIRGSVMALARAQGATYREIEEVQHVSRKTIADLISRASRAPLI